MKHVVNTTFAKTNYDVGLLIVFYYVELLIFSSNLRFFVMLIVMFFFFFVMLNSTLLANEFESNKLFEFNLCSPDLNLASAPTSSFS